MSKNSVWNLLEDLKKKKGITEVIINNADFIYIERQGDLIRLNVELEDEDIYSFCNDVAKMNKQSFGKDHPVLDGTLDDGSRINILDSTYTNGMPAITIRKYLREISNFDSLEGKFLISQKWISFLRTIVTSKCNIIVSGGTGVGKTTLLNLLLQEMKHTERVITIEDTRELFFNIPNQLNLITANAFSKVKNPLKMRDLLKNTLRMRPDRIIVGEVRGEEAFDLLQAMNTGHDGSMCSVHANSPAEALSRLENLFLFAGFNVPLKAVREQLVSAIDFIIQIEKNRNGERVISRITELSNMEGDTILLQDIGRKGEFGLEFTGLAPKRMMHLIAEGLPKDFFNEI